MRSRAPTRRVVAAWLVALVATPVLYARSEPPTMANVLGQAVASDWRELDPENTLYLELDAGRVVIELAPDFAPQHVANVRALAREGYWDGLAVVRVQDNYVVQWMDPHVADEERRRAISGAQRHLTAEFSVPLDDDVPFTRLPDVDGYAPEVGFSSGFPAARDPGSGRAWLAHCYGMVGAGRENAADSGGGPELYAVIGHAPRHLDRNVTLLGRVVWGIELFSVLPRGGGAMGFFEESEGNVPIRSVNVAADLPVGERTRLQLLRTDTPTFEQLIEARRNRVEEWFVQPTGHVGLCNVPLPVRLIGAPD